MREENRIVPQGPAGSQVWYGTTVQRKLTGTIPRTIQNVVDNESQVVSEVYVKDEGERFEGGPSP